MFIMPRKVGLCCEMYHAVMKSKDTATNVKEELESMWGTT